MSKSPTLVIIAAVIVVAIVAVVLFLPRESTPPSIVTIYHWWTAGGEREAFEAVTGVLAEEYPDINIMPSAVAGGAGGGMVIAIKTMIIAGNPPDSYQCHLGYEMYPYYEGEALRDLTSLWENDNLESRVPNVLANMCKIGENYYIVPIGVHRTNVVWYNKQIFEECGVEPPSDPVTWENFWALCDELKSKLPAGKYPLELADGEEWPATQVFETIMMGTDPQTYQDFINGHVTAEQLVPVLERFKKYMSYVSPNHRYPWGEGCGNLIAGSDPSSSWGSAMYLMGDWVKGYFITRGWVCDNQYGYFAAPGTSGWFGMCIDGFVTPNGAQNENNAIRWLHTCSTVEAQVKFNPLKGSVSPYEDVPLDIYDNYSRRCAEELYNPITKFYPSIAHGSGSPVDGVVIELHKKTADFTSSLPDNVEGTANIIADLVNGVSHPLTWNIV